MMTKLDTTQIWPSSSSSLSLQFIMILVVTMARNMIPVVVHANLHVMCVPGDAFSTTKAGESSGLLLQTSTCDTVKALNALLGACATKAQGPNPDLAEGMPLVEYTEVQDVLQGVVEAALFVNSTTDATEGPVRHLLRNMEKEKRSTTDHH
jgi:hypothetical protein